MHAPQFIASLATSVHTPAQICSSCGHPHFPSAQVADEGHAIPHAPQFAASVDVSTHDVPHDTRPIAHAASHAPAEHASPASHTWPHEPQFFASFVKSTQALPHAV
jgi:hypothetical protein